jgi:hypothetical protein
VAAHGHGPEFGGHPAVLLKATSRIVDSQAQQPASFQQDLTTLFDCLRAGYTRLIVAARLMPEKVRRGYERLESGLVCGQQVFCLESRNRRTCCFSRTAIKGTCRGADTSRF